MALVIKFPGPAPPLGVDQGIIALAERLLAQARQGQVQSLVAVFANADGIPNIMMLLDRRHAAGLSGALQVGAVKIARLLDLTLSDNEADEDLVEEQE
jgi:hypothetical protein